MMEKIEGRRRRGRQKMRWMDGIINSMDLSFSKVGDSKGQGSLALLQSTESQRVRHDLVTEKQQQQMIITKTYNDNNSKRSNNTNDKHHISFTYMMLLLDFYFIICKYAIWFTTIKSYIQIFFLNNIEGLWIGEQKICEFILLTPLANLLTFCLILPFN